MTAHEDKQVAHQECNSKIRLELRCQQEVNEFRLRRIGAPSLPSTVLTTPHQTPDTSANHQRALQSRKWAPIGSVMFAALLLPVQQQKPQNSNTCCRPFRVFKVTQVALLPHGLSARFRRASLLLQAAECEYQAQPAAAQSGVAFTPTRHLDRMSACLRIWGSPL